MYDELLKRADDMSALDCRTTPQMASEIIEELSAAIRDLTAKLEAVKPTPIDLYDISVRFGISYEELMEMFGHVVPSTMSTKGLRHE